MLRRAFITGIVSALAAPAIVKAEVLMPLRVIHSGPLVITWPGWLPTDGRLISRAMYPELFAVLNVGNKVFGEFAELPAIGGGVMVKAGDTPNNRLVPVGTLLGLDYDKLAPHVQNGPFHTNVVDYDP